MFLMHIPMLSMMLMLIAGILVGHLIWYRDRREDAAALEAADGRCQRAQDALENQNRIGSDLQRQLQEAEERSLNLQAANQQLRHDGRAAQAEHDHLESELARWKQFHHQAFRDLDEERQRRRTLEKLRTDHEAQRAELHDALRRLQAELASRQEEIHSLREERDELSDLLDGQRERCRRMEDRARSVQQLVSQRDEAAARAASLERIAEQLRSQLQEAGQQLRRTTRNQAADWPTLADARQMGLNRQPGAESAHQRPPGQSPISDDACRADGDPSAGLMLRWPIALPAPAGHDAGKTRTEDRAA
jgi:chromosome segregation ATPase